uniref:Bromodomain adjacent to zinc finger domain protein 1A n=1 Tax=Trichobilharzia regenti TaxID=157069 RepID=A0AA85KNW8_TRIRE|nr:unnamed protein product [Trichobilharzia regenti]
MRFVGAAKDASYQCKTTCTESNLEEKETSIWTCRVTGKSNLTYREALKTEATAIKTLKKCFPKFFEKTILERIHLSTLPLESLVHNCWTAIHEQFHIAEPVKLKVDSASSIPIRGIIDDIIKSQPVPPPVPDNTSPNNSDKENVTRKNSPVKKDYAYSIKVLADIPVVVHDIPACSIDRVSRAPSKEHIRMFIRSHAMRYGPNFTGPWIVNEELLRRHKIPLKSPGFQVDKVKLKQMSKTLEEEYFIRIMNSRRQANGEGTSEDVSTSTPLNFKRIKRFSVLRDDSTSRQREENEDDLPLAQLKDRSQAKQSSSDDGSKKKMKQATLFQFGKKDSSKEEATDSSTVNRPKKSVLPRVAQHLIKMFEENKDNPAIENQIKVCAKFITDIDLLKLPVELRDRVREKKEEFEFRKKLMAMTPAERKEALQEMKEKRKIERIHANKLIDDLQLTKSLPQCPCLPKPSKLEFPTGFTESLFGRLLGLTEFFHIFHNLLVEGSMDDADADNAADNTIVSPVDSLVPSYGEPGYSDDDDEGNTDEEEGEAELTESTAPLPKICIKALRRLGLKRLLNAITTNKPTVGAYRSLARPLSVLLRLVLKDEQLSKKRELGIKLAKFPVTPYTAPELLRLTLLHEVPLNHSPIVKSEEFLKHDNSVTELKQFERSTVIQLVHHLSNSDLHELFPEARVLALESAVEKIFDLDLIDDHIMACQRRATEAYLKKIQVLRDKNIRKKDKKDNAVETGKVNGTPSTNQNNESLSKTETSATTEQKDNAEFDNDLASIVKRRRIMAARAAIEREEKENLERQRRLELAQEQAEERAINAVTRLYDTRSAEAKCVFRVNQLVMIDIIVVSANWACSDIMYSANPSKALQDDETIPEPAHLCVHNDQLRMIQHYVALGAVGIFMIVQNNWMNYQTLYCQMVWKSAPSSSENPVPSENSTTNLTPVDPVKSVTQKRNLNAGAALAGALLKNILDTEVRLRSGGLGGVPDFTEFQERMAQVQTSYGLSQDYLSGHLTSKSTSSSTGSQSPNREGLVNALIEVAEHIIPRFLNVPDLTSKAQLNSALQNPSDPSADVKNSMTTDHISRAKYSSDEESDSSDTNDQELEKAILDPEAHEQRTRTWMTVWRNEVRSARTLARLNLLHACLDACVLWEKSVEDARCRICRRKTDDDNLLLCDGCNLAYHLYCLRPPLKRVPAGDWFCPTCRPVSRALEKRKREERLARSARRRKRAVSSDDDDDDGENESDDNQDSSAESEDIRTTRRRNPRRVSPSSRHPVASKSIKHDTSCLVCSDSIGDLISCSCCPNIFHLDCHEPPLHHIPRGDGWQCSSCRLNKNRTLITSYFQSRDYRQKVYQMNFKKRTVSPEEEHSEDEFVNNSHSTRSMRTRNRSQRSVANSDTDDQQRSSLASSDVDSRSNSQQPTSSRRRRRSTSRSASALGAQLKNHAKRRRHNSSGAEDDSTTETEQMDEQSSQALCSQILDTVFKHKQSWPFRKPVDRSQVPDYYEIITDPVDLSMMRDWLSEGRYTTENVSEGLENLARDFGTLFYNAELYNAADSDVWLAGEQLENFVKNQFAQMTNDVVYSRPALGDM